jgi:hypothetical protein
MIRVRTLGPADATSMRTVLSVFGEAFQDAGTYTTAQPGTGYLERLLGSDAFIAIAALDGNRVVGGIAAYVLPKFEQECQTWRPRGRHAFRHRGSDLESASIVRATPNAVADEIPSVALPCGIIETGCPIESSIDGASP